MGGSQKDRTFDIHVHVDDDGCVWRLLWLVGPLQDVGMPAEYVNKLARMFQDIRVSEGLNQEFKESYKGSAVAGGHYLEALGVGGMGGGRVIDSCSLHV